MGDRSERRGVEAEGEGRNGGAQQGVCRRVGMCRAGGTARIILGDDFVDSGRELDEKVLFDVAATP